MPEGWKKALHVPAQAGQWSVKTALRETVGAMRETVGATLKSHKDPVGGTMPVGGTLQSHQRDNDSGRGKTGRGLERPRDLSYWDRFIEKALDTIGPRTAEAAPLFPNSTIFQHLYFYHYDHLGSVRLVTAGKNYYGNGQTWTQLTTQGTIYERTDYLPFGEIFHDSNSAYTANPDNDFFRSREKYTGKQWDYLTGLYYYGARMYDPEVGQFTQADTSIPTPTDGQAFNRYSYANNNPYKYVDPSGHNAIASFFIGLVEAVIVGVCFAINPVLGMAVSGLIGAIHALIAGASLAQAGMAFAQGFIMAGVSSIPYLGLALAAYGIFQAIASNSPDAMGACLGGLIGGLLIQGMSSEDTSMAKTSSGKEATGTEKNDGQQVLDKTWAELNKEQEGHSLSADVRNFVFKNLQNKNVTIRAIDSDSEVSFVDPGLGAGVQAKDCGRYDGLTLKKGDQVSLNGQDWKTLGDNENVVLVWTKGRTNDSIRGFMIHEALHVAFGPGTEVTSRVLGVVFTHINQVNISGQGMKQVFQTGVYPIGHPLKTTWNTMQQQVSVESILYNSVTIK